MKQTTSFVTAVIVLNSLFSSGQSNTVGAGGDASGSGGSVAFSVGQIDYKHFNSSGGSASLGVQQPYSIEETNSLSESGELISVTIGPNPGSDWLSILTESDKNYRFYITDSNGKIVLEEHILQGSHQVSMNHWATGMYFLHISDDQKPVKQIKIIKH
jgi:hypothetical protein